MFMSRTLTHAIDQEIIGAIFKQTGAEPFDVEQNQLELHLYLDPDQLDWCYQTGCKITQVLDQGYQIGLTFATHEQATQFLLAWQPQGETWWIGD